MNSCVSNSSRSQWRSFKNTLFCSRSSKKRVRKLPRESQRKPSAVVCPQMQSQFQKGCSIIKTGSFSSQIFHNGVQLAPPCRLSKCFCILGGFIFALEKQFHRACTEAFAYRQFFRCKWNQNERSHQIHFLFFDMMNGYDNQKSFYYYLHSMTWSRPSCLSKLTKHCLKNNNLLQYERQCTPLPLRSIHLRTIY